MNTNDISCDCETLGTAYDAPIIAIGAVCFDRTTGILGAKFYEVIELDSAIKSGRVDGRTLSWWITQSKDAKRIFGEEAQKNARSLATTLLAFSDWCRSQGKGVPRVWTKGPANDVTWIEHAMHAGGHGLAVPWHHTNVRDVRTIIELAEEIAGFNPRSVPDVRTSHNALDDAIYQANTISACYAALNELPGQRLARVKKDLGITKAKKLIEAAAGDDDEL